MALKNLIIFVRYVVGESILSKFIVFCIIWWWRRWCWYRPEQKQICWKMMCCKAIVKGVSQVMIVTLKNRTLLLPGLLPVYCLISIVDNKYENRFQFMPKETTYFSSCSRSCWCKKVEKNTRMLIIFMAAGEKEF